MKRSLLLWQVSGLTFSAVLGTLFHFLYDWTGFILFAPFSAVNESTWEHMKLLFVPSFIFAIIQSFFAKNDYKCFWLVKLIGIVIGTLLIPILFYTLGGAFGELSAIINISIFFVAVISQYLIEMFLFGKIDCALSVKWVCFIALLLIFVLFVVFTFYPPKIPLFLDPLTSKYGIILRS